MEKCLLNWITYDVRCFLKEILVYPNWQDADIGDTVKFSCYAAGLENVTHYFWTVNGSVIMCDGCSSDQNIPGAVHFNVTSSAGVLILLTYMLHPFIATILLYVVLWHRRRKMGCHKHFSYFSMKIIHIVPPLEPMA